MRALAVFAALLGSLAVALFVYLSVGEKAAARAELAAASLPSASEDDAAVPGSPAPGADLAPPRIATPPAPEDPTREDSTATPPAAAEPLSTEDRSLEASILTDDPDLQGLKDRVADLAFGATVQEDSVVVQDGHVTGTVLLASGKTGSFEIDDAGRYTVRIEDFGPPEGDGQFLLQETVIGFQEKGSSTRSGFANLAFHPKTSVAPEGTSIVGWSLSVTDQGTEAKGTIAGPGGAPGSWRIGPDPALRIERDWEHTRHEFERWRLLLGPHRSR